VTSVAAVWVGPDIGGGAAAVGAGAAVALVGGGAVREGEGVGEKAVCVVPVGLVESSDTVTTAVTSTASTTASPPAASTAEVLRCQRLTGATLGMAPDVKRSRGFWLGRETCQKWPKRSLVLSRVFPVD
jgi:hypothetical protein